MCVYSLSGFCFRRYGHRHSHPLGLSRTHFLFLPRVAVDFGALVEVVVVITATIISTKCVRKQLELLLASIATAFTNSRSLSRCKCL